MQVYQWLWLIVVGFVVVFAGIVAFAQAAWFSPGPPLLIAAVVAVIIWFKNYTKTPMG